MSAREDARPPVLYVLKRFPRLSETFVLREVLALEAAGERVAIDALLAPEDEPHHPELAMLQADVRRLPRRPRASQPAIWWPHLRLAARRPRVWWRCARRARRHDEWRRFLQAGLVADRARRLGARHVHAHFATAAAVVARDAAALAGVPFTVTAHAKDVFASANAPLLAARVDGAAAVVTVSRWNAAHLEQVLPGVPIRYVPNGAPLPDACGPAAGGTVLCVARLVPKKGVDVLLEAAAQLATERPDLHVEIVGGGVEADALRQRASALGLEDTVTFLGPQPSPAVDDAYRRAAVVVLPCRVAADGDRDGMPTVLVEAMGRALPVVSTEVAGIPELVRPGDTGLLVPPDDPAALASAVRKLLDDPDLGIELGRRARRLVAREFDPGRSVALLREVFATCGGGAE